MNKFIWVIIILIFTVQARAQKFDIGPKLGIHAYTVSYRFDEAKDKFNGKTRLGFTLGGSLKTNLKPTFAIVAEFQYSLKGKKNEIKESDWDIIYTHHFLEAPILLRYLFEESSYEGIRFRPYFNIGPKISYWLLPGKGRLVTPNGPGAEYDIEFDSNNEDFNTLVINDPNRWMFGLDIGAGAQIQIKREQHVTIELRFSLGHSFLGNPDSVVYPILGFEDDLETRYRLLSLTAAYQFEIDWRERRKGKSTIKNKKRR